MTREDIDRIASEYFDDKESEHEMDEVFDLAKKALEKQMSRSENSNNWISVSERLPEGLLVKTLVSCEDSLGLPIVPKIALYDGYEHSWVCDEKVIAWMPLPLCYDPQKSEDKE